MSNWFDGYAKRAARSEGSASASEGITRRQALIGGAVATGVMWTAPALLSATPAWAVGSCPNNAVRCGTANPTTGLKPCCPNATDTCPTATNVCTQQGNVGGACKTETGQGTSGCNNTTGQNGSNIACNKGTPNICGGVGSTCVADSDCSPDAPFCKGTTRTNKVCSTTGPSGP